VARVSAPALTAVDLAAGTDGESIDRVLLSRQARLDDLWQALERCAHRRGVRASKRRLIESRAEPWSKAERILHRHLRAAGIRGWRANGEVWINDRQYFPDVGFFALKLAVEVDGRIHLYDPETFQKDRQRQNAFVLAGWTVLRFTWQDITERPDIVIAQIRAALAMLRRRAQRVAQPRSAARPVVADRARLSAGELVRHAEQVGDAAVAPAAGVG
jgi:very-short-patch-repair endonuclease